MKYFRFSGLLTETNWLMPAYVGVDDKGVISYLSEEPPHGCATESVIGYALPGFQNAHSHAFQYAMVGMAEVHPSGMSDDFWSWREAMYQCALTVDPDQMEVIATMLYTEMLRHGFTHVAEFHYLHHNENGEQYSNLAETGSRLVSAAKTSGIKITLIPVFYQRGGFGRPAEPRQTKFLSRTTDDYFRLLDASKVVIRDYDGANLGFGVHSLRAVSANDCLRTIEQGPNDLPFHLHVAEQIKEVEDSIAFCNQRPVQWLLDHVDLSRRFNLVHATHLDDQELKGLAASGATVVLCASTEGNLGDGIFGMKAYTEAGGRWCIGTDSHIGLQPLEEFRMIDYRQRLVAHQRNPLGANGARYMVNESTMSGRRAMGFSEMPFCGVGQYFDAVVYDGRHPLLHSALPSNLLSTIVYHVDRSGILGTIVNGRWRIKNQVHASGESILKSFREVLRQLQNRQL